MLKTVYVSKTILSQSLSANLFRYVDVKKILEVEIGITQNEPKQLAVKEAIDKAVEYLTIEGILDGIWSVNANQEKLQELAYKYSEEVEEAVILTEDVLYLSGERVRLSGRIYSNGGKEISEHGFEISLSESYENPILIQNGIKKYRYGRQHTYGCHNLVAIDQAFGQHAQNSKDKKQPGIKPPALLFSLMQIQTHDQRHQKASGNPIQVPAGNHQPGTQKDR